MEADWSRNVQITDNYVEASYGGILAGFIRSRDLGSGQYLNHKDISITGVFHSNRNNSFSAWSCWGLLARMKAKAHRRACIAEEISGCRTVHHRHTAAEAGEMGISLCRPPFPDCSGTGVISNSSQQRTKDDLPQDRFLWFYKVD